MQVTVIEHNEYEDTLIYDVDDDDYKNFLEENELSEEEDDYLLDYIRASGIPYTVADSSYIDTLDRYVDSIE